MTHPLVTSHAGHLMTDALLSHVVVQAAGVPGVGLARVVAAPGGGYRLHCRIRPVWWVLLGVRHAVVRARVRRCLLALFERWPDPGVRSVWVT